jgi:biopolymer transport protein ExbD
MSRLVRVSVVALLAVALADRVEGQNALLPTPPAEVLTSPTRIVLQLPESGGLAINHQPIQPQTLEAELRAIFAQRPSKVLLVDAHPSRSRTEIEQVLRVAESQGIRVYAARPTRIRI